MARAFSFKGKSLEELQQLSMQEFAKLVPSRARRSLLRDNNRNIMKKVAGARKKGIGTPAKPIRTHRRATVITPNMVGLHFGVYNGKEFLPVVVTADMLGHYLGEMSLTRKRLVHGKAGIGATKSSTAITARG